MAYQKSSQTGGHPSSKGRGNATMADPYGYPPTTLAGFAFSAKKKSVENPASAIDDLPSSSIRNGIEERGLSTSGQYFSASDMPPEVNKYPPDLSGASPAGPSGGVSTLIGAAGVSIPGGTPATAKAPPGAIEAHNDEKGRVQREFVMKNDAQELGARRDLNLHFPSCFPLSFCTLLLPDRASYPFSGFGFVSYQCFNYSNRTCALELQASPGPQPAHMIPKKRAIRMSCGWLTNGIGKEGAQSPEHSDLSGQEELRIKKLDRLANFRCKARRRGITNPSCAIGPVLGQGGRIPDEGVQLVANHQGMKETRGILASARARVAALGSDGAAEAVSHPPKDLAFGEREGGVVGSLAEASGTTLTEEEKMWILDAVDILYNAVASA